MIGVKAPEQLGKLSVRNDLAFLTTVVLCSSLGAVVLGQLPGMWGFWGAYGTGGISCERRLAGRRPSRPLPLVRSSSPAVLPA
jgi:hypothetical protein